MDDGHVSLQCGDAESDTRHQDSLIQQHSAQAADKRHPSHAPETA